MARRRDETSWRSAEYGSAGFAGLETRLFAGTHREVAGRSVRYLWCQGPVRRDPDPSRER